MPGRFEDSELQQGRKSNKIPEESWAGRLTPGAAAPDVESKASTQGGSVQAWVHSPCRMPRYQELSEELSTTLRWR